MIRSGSYYISLRTDETDDPRPSTTYLLTIGVNRIPKAWTKPHCNAVLFCFKVCKAEDDHNPQAFLSRLSNECKP